LKQINNFAVRHLREIPIPVSHRQEWGGSLEAYYSIYVGSYCSE